jgi:hypothetical protein
MHHEQQANKFVPLNFHWPVGCRARGAFPSARTLSAGAVAAIRPPPGGGAARAGSVASAPQHSPVKEHLYAFFDYL